MTGVTTIMLIIVVNTMHRSSTGTWYDTVPRLKSTNRWRQALPPQVLALRPRSGVGLAGECGVGYLSYLDAHNLWTLPRTGVSKAILILIVPAYYTHFAGILGGTVRGARPWSDILSRCYRYRPFRCSSVA
eukprot:COSAG02_NODE_1197_length_13932_cov_42.811176_3_plen_131_part_00